MSLNNSQKKNIEFLDHTGDVGVKIYAETLEQVFQLAAASMFHIICTDEVADVKSRIIKVEGADLEQLLVNWLSELNFFFQTEQFLLADVRLLKIDGLMLTAEVSGEKVDVKKHNIHTEIKAVTYHKLKVEHKEEKWTVQVIFDI